MHSQCRERQRDTRASWSPAGFAHPRFASPVAHNEEGRARPRPASSSLSSLCGVAVTRAEGAAGERETTPPETRCRESPWRWRRLLGGAADSSTHELAPHPVARHNITHGHHHLSTTTSRTATTTSTTTSRTATTSSTTTSRTAIHLISNNITHGHHLNNNNITHGHHLNNNEPNTGPHH
ncbi:unnamed protein product [Lampetra fluviatilis]